MADEDRYSLAAARVAAERGELEAWVAAFLASPGSDNADLADQLAERVGLWDGPMLVPLDALHRLAGAPGTPALVALEEDEWRDDLDELAEKVQRDDWEPPPLIVTYRDDQLVLEDGNHRVEAARRAGRRRAWAVVGFADRAAQEGFTVPSTA